MKDSWCVGRGPRVSRSPTADPKGVPPCEEWVLGEELRVWREQVPTGEGGSKL